MSLLDTASLILTPNGYKDGVTTGKLYSVKPTNGDGDMVVTRNTTATRVNSAGVIESVAFNAPRIDYTNASCPSILVEPARTNLVTYSNNFTDASWTKSLATLTPNFGISPDGTQNSTKINFQINAQLYKLIGTTSNAVSSIYIKGVNGETIQFFNNQTNAYITRTLNGTWQRFVDIAIGTTFSYVGIGTLGGVTARVVEVYGAQLELGSNATSYIPTVASTVTRNADVISKTGISSLIGQTEGTIYSEIRVNKLLGTASRYVFHLSDGTANNRIYMAFSGVSSNILRARIFNGGTLQCSIDSSTITATGTYKLALAYKNNDIVFYINGVQIGTDTSATIPTCSQVDLGHNYAGASQLNDGINNANIWKTRLTNAQLATLTTL